jgi:phosphonate transport system permease protein
VSQDQAPTQVRPAPPRRAWSMAGALFVAVTATVAGAATAEFAFGSVWGLIAAGGILVALRMGRVSVTPIDQAVIASGMIASTVLSTRVVPDALPTVDVLVCVQFAAAWVPAGLACGVVVFRRGGTLSSSFNTALLWVVGGALAIPAAEALGILRPIDSLRRGLEPVFGKGDYMTLALFVGVLGIATFLAVVTRLPALAATSAVVLFTLFAGAVVGFTIPGLIRNFANIVNIPNFWPPDFGWAIGDGTWWWLPSWEFGAPLRDNPLVETFRIAIMATVLGCTIALPVAFMASTLTAPNKPIYLIDKGFLNVVRTVPDLFWAMIFVLALGFGPFAGAIALIIFSMSIMGKLLSETIDAADPGPLEAAKAAGGRHFTAVRSAVLPQVLPNYVALGLYIFELNIRASAVLGLVGAGGIGRVIEAQRVFFRFDRVLAIIIAIWVVVFVLEQISVSIRRRLV